MGLSPLKVHLHEIFYFCFFSSKAPTWSSDSYPKFVSNITSISPRYSHYSSLCIDSVDVEAHLALTQLTRNETPRQLSHR